MNSSLIAFLGLALYLALQVGFIARALLRPHREPASRIAWVLVILALPAIGMISYILFGETNIGRRRVARYRAATDLVGPGEPQLSTETDRITGFDPTTEQLFRLGHSISGFFPVHGNKAHVLSDSNATIDAMVADIDAAEHHVHLLFYIWLEDTNGLKIVEAVKRAAARGVIVRAMADDLGSRGLIRSRHWKDMENAGVRLARALPVGILLFHPIRGRVDLRNHRKIVVIDHRITYCGSQNCADAEFLPKAKYAPWVDLMVRFEGRIAGQNQRLFLQDWISHVDDPLSDLETAPLPGNATGGIVAQVIGTGPTVRNSAMPELFEALMHSAREELVITTPYFVPSDSMQSALRSAAFRGVRTTLVLPRKNDSWIVAAASRSYYAELLEAGVRIFEYSGGLLHAKSLTVDGHTALIGSANLDRRSFDLNYENNILLQDSKLAADLVNRQREYISASQEVTLADAEGWSAARRLWNNSVAMLGPVL
jgi:cardiolipin synthase